MTAYTAADVTVISVCYHSDEVVGAMVDSIPSECQIILVDNGNTNTFASVKRENRVKILRLEKNLGFGAGCNVGARSSTTKFLLFLNPDARLGSEKTIMSFLDGVKRHPKAAAFNPRIIGEGGKHYFKRRSYLLPRSKWMRRGQPTIDTEVPVLSGAALFLAKENFHRVGGFDNEIFLYHEDDDISIRLGQIGPLFYLRDAEVFHASGRSTKRSPEIAYFKGEQLTISRIFAGRKHGKALPVVSALIQAILVLISPLNFVSKRRRWKALGMLKGIINSSIFR
ncbi:glycosyltransferase [Agrobacterium salinitolerans]|uniref:glycosyltransferase n=1 Tax=Agrobacterium salinitolerans TaxID=1183413 RepID=UPI00157447FB|nr:glycosyltransferase family 2 protein [Agrobacterium salinitolerans]